MAKSQVHYVFCLARARKERERETERERERDETVHISTHTGVLYTVNE